MKKYKLLRFGHCYVNLDGDLAVKLLSGDKKHGYKFIGSHAHPNVFLDEFQLLSRIVPNNGKWREIDHEMFNVISQFHIMGRLMKFSTKSGLRTSIISEN